MSTKYYRVRSTLKAAHGFNRVTIVKDKDGKPRNRSHQVIIPGKYRPNDPPAIGFITDEEYKGIAYPGSPFSQLLQETQDGATHGVTVKECLFSEMPDECQKKFNPQYFAKLQAAMAKSQAKADEEAAKD